MKLQLTLSLILSALLLISCEKEELSSNIWRVDGEIYNGSAYDNQIDSIYGKYYYYGDNAGVEYFPSCKLKNGKFSMQLQQIPDERLDNNYRVICPYASFVSDTTVKINSLIIRCKWREYSIGYLFLNNGKDPEEVGYTYCEYIYCNKPFSVKGIRRFITKINSYTETYTQTYYLTFRRGWNVITRTSSLNGTEQKEDYLSNVIPADVAWRPSIMQAVWGPQ